MRLCSVHGCIGKHLAKGLCRAHYLRMYRRGELDLAVMRGATAVERIMAKVEIQSNGCWIFTGCLTSNGYGHIRVGRSMKSAHVVTYEAKHGPVPPGKELDHVHCQQRACCNPDHVEPVTNLENIRRAAASKTWGYARLAPAERRVQAAHAANVRWGNLTKGLT